MGNKFSRKNDQQDETEKQFPFDRKLISIKNQNDNEINNSDYKLSIMSYNVLSDPHAFQLAHPQCQQKYLNFKYRSSKIIEAIQHFGTDIICLQEIDKYDEFYQKKLQKLGYKTHFFPKCPSHIETFKGKKEFTYGNLVGVNSEKYEIIEIEQVLYGNLIPANILEKWEKYQCDERAIVFKVKDIKNGVILNIINTHFISDPKQDYLKYFQMVSLKKIIEEKFDYQKDNVITCGDFNSVPDSNAVQFMLNQEIPPDIERIEFKQAKKWFKDYQNIFDNYHIKFINQKPKFQFKSAYQNYNGEGNHPKFTNYTQRFQGNLDYIFYSENGLQLESILETKEEKYEENKGYIPDKNNPSDHIPLIATFSLKI